MTQTNAADRKSIRAAEKAAALLEQAEREVTISIMSTGPGRAYMWRRLEAARVFSTTYSDDTHRMAFQEGERNAGLQLLNSLMQFCPDLFILAMREANERRTADLTHADRAAAAEHLGSEGTGRDVEGSEPIVGSDADEGYGFPDTAN